MLRLILTVCAAACALVMAGCDKKTQAILAEPAVVAAAPVAEVAPAKAEMTVPEFTVSTAAADIEKGKEAFAMKGCLACHKVGGGRLVGPDLKGIMTRRDETWVKKMILYPDVMVKEDPAAKKLFTEYLTPMPNQGVDPKNDLPFIMAYLKSAE